MGKVELYPHNQEAYKKIEQSIANGDKKIAISHATGTGKSYLIAKLCEDYNEDRKLVLVPSRHIKKEIKSLLKENYIKNVDVKLYQGLIKMTDDYISEMNYKIVALDEYHHDTAKVWGYKVRTLIDSHPETIFFGTSATPVRTDGVNVIDELFDGNCVSSISLPQAIARGIVPCPKYVAAFYTLDERLNELRRKIEKSTNNKEEKDEFYNKINTMRSQIEKAYGMPIILNNNIKDKEGKYIVFCKNKKHLEKVKDTVIDWFKTAGFKNINSYVVHSSYDNKDEEYEAFCNDTSHSLKLLFCINMLNEGSHKTNISGALLLRKTNSYIMLLQQIGRTIESGKSNNPIIIDAVNNFIYVKDGIKLLTEIKEAIDEEKKNNKDFDESKFIDIDTFFVTEYVQNIEDMLNEIENKLIKGRIIFTEYEDDIIKTYFPNEGSKGCMKYIKDKTRDQIVSRAKTLGVSYHIDLTPKWTKEKIQYLLDNYEDTSIPIKEMEKVLNLSNHQIRSKASRLNLLRKNLSEKEKRFIEDEYPIHGAEWVAEKIGRTINVIYQYASSHGIKGRRVNAIFTPNDDKKIIKYYPTMGADCVIYFDNISKQQIRARAAKLNVTFLEEENKEKIFYDRCSEIENAKKEGIKINTTMNYNGIPLGSFIRQIRVKYKNNKLTKEQIDRAKEVGIL